MSTDPVTPVVPGAAPAVPEEGTVPGAAPTAATQLTVSSMADLQTKAPELYNAMLQGMAWNICSDQNRSIERIKEELRKEREENK